MVGIQIFNVNLFQCLYLFENVHNKMLKQIPIKTYKKMHTYHHDKPQLADEANLRNTNGSLSQLCQASAGSQRYIGYQQEDRRVVSLSLRAAFWTSLSSVLSFSIPFHQYFSIYTPGDHNSLKTTKQERKGKLGVHNTIWEVSIPHPEAKAKERVCSSNMCWIL